MGIGWCSFQYFIRRKKGRSTVRNWLTRMEDECFSISILLEPCFSRIFRFFVILFNLFWVCWRCAEGNQYFIIIDENEYSMNVPFISVNCDQCIQTLMLWNAQNAMLSHTLIDAHMHTFIHDVADFSGHHVSIHMQTNKHPCSAHWNAIAVYISFIFTFTFKFNKTLCIKCLTLLFHILFSMCTCFDTVLN